MLIIGGLGYGIKTTPGHSNRVFSCKFVSSDQVHISMYVHICFYVYLCTYMQLKCFYLEHIYKNKHMYMCV
jgi:hypothetical protein